jgi:hypothetical protein
MLYADKRALETNLKVSLLQIREKELNFYTQNCLAVGTQAALLAGFAYAGLTQVSVPPEAPYAVRLFYLLFTTAAMSCELIAVLNTTLLSMLGPGLALRGPDGSMHQAVDGMMLEYRRAFFAFGLGLLAFHMSALMFGWLMFRPRACARCRALAAMQPPGAPTVQTAGKLSAQRNRQHAQPCPRSALPGSAVPCRAEPSGERVAVPRES